VQTGIARGKTIPRIKEEGGCVAEGKRRRMLKKVRKKKEPKTVVQAVSPFPAPLGGKKEVA